MNEKQLNAHTANTILHLFNDGTGQSLSQQMYNFNCSKLNREQQILLLNACDDLRQKIENSVR